MNVLKKISDVFKKIFFHDFLTTTILVVFIIICFNFLLAMYFADRHWKKCVAEFSVSDCEDFEF